MQCMTLTVITCRRPWCPSNTVDWQKLPDRMIYTNIPDTQVPNNNIKTTNSNVITFIPSNLLSQFSKSANIYFVLVAILQSIPGVSVTNGQPMVLIPLSMVVLGVLLKDAYEEYSRYRKDWEANNQSINILKNGNFQRTTWQRLMIGDVIMIHREEYAPCDFVVLQSSDSKGRCYVETKNLDGETNQKIKKVPNPQHFNLQMLSPAALWNERFQLKYEKPNPNLHHFNGNISIKDQVLPLTQSNIILRGSSLQTVDWARGVCVYTGKETKLSLNSVQFRTKRSKLDKQLGSIIIIVVILQIVIAFTCASLNYVIQDKHIRELGEVPHKPFWMTLGSWWLIMSYFIPISLIVSLESIRLAQAAMMCQDERMLPRSNNTIPQMNNSSVNEDLGQIRYVFSDKTGTLTSNIMNFKMMSIAGTTYGDYSKSSTSEQQMRMKQLNITNVDFNDTQFLRRSSQKQFQDFFKILFLCHQIIVEHSPEGQIKYSASSPDEIAFINFAKFCGYEYQGEQNRFMVVKNLKTNTIQRYKLLTLLQFSSDRKRMSVIVQEDNGEIFLYTKGADSLIIPRVRRNDPLLGVTSQHIEQLSNNGLRTLILAKRQISEGEFSEWNRHYHQATTSINNRQKNIEKACELIQVNLSIVGATGIQDKLQQNVQQTIEQMKECGIIFYILTGDKRQTAVNIGRSCGMISKNTQIITAPEDLTPEEFVKWTQDKFPLPDNSVLLLNATLPITKINIPLHPTICYRCTPTQKQNIVKSVKSQTNQLTLAIGDGSNDVNMITVADVGISIRGVEGNDVTRVSDFVIGQYSLLAPLVLYYGRQWYRKNAKFVNYGMLKNIYHVAAVIGFGGFSMFGGLVIYEPIIYHFFNTFFTIAASCVYAVLDQDWSMENSVKYPELLYPPGQRGVYFNQGTYWKNFFLGLFYGILTQYLVYFFLEFSPLNQGRLSHLSQGGMVILFIIILVVNIKILLMAHVYHLILIIAVLGSLLVYFGIYVGFVWYNPYSEVSFPLRTLFTTPMIWAIIVLICFITLGLDFALKKYSDYSKNMIFNQQVEFKQAWIEKR